MSTSSAVNQGQVTYSISEKGVGTITFEHPLSNSLPGKLLQKLADTITELGKNTAVKVIVLQSSGERAFCAGASFDSLQINLFFVLQRDQQQKVRYPQQVLIISQQRTP